MQNNSIKSLLQIGARELKSASDSPELDSEVLLSYAFKKDKAWLFTHPNEKLCPQKNKLFRKLIKKRSKGVPVAYLTGEKEFFGRSFFVNKNVLIPRPITENLIEKALEIIKSRCQGGSKPVMIDVGTGSGCIAVTIACEAPDVKIIAIDILEKALRVTRKNAKRHKVEKRIRFLHGDLLDPILSWILSARCAGLQNDTRELLVMANLPYLKPGQIKQSVKFEPKIALDGGRDGLNLYRKLEKQIKKLAIICERPITLISERPYSKDSSVPRATIEIQTFPGAKASSRPSIP